MLQSVFFFIDEVLIVGAKQTDQQGAYDTEITLRYGSKERRKAFKEAWRERLSKAPPATSMLEQSYSEKDLRGFPWLSELPIRFRPAIFNYLTQVLRTSNMTRKELRQLIISEELIPGCSAGIGKQCFLACCKAALVNPIVFRGRPWMSPNPKGDQQ